MILFPALAFLQQTQPDEGSIEKMKVALTATGLNHELSASKLSFKLLFDHPESRKQTIYVSPKQNTVTDSLKTYFLYTTVWVSKEAPSSDLVQSVVSKVKKFGTFYVFKDTQGVWAIRFGAHFVASTLPDGTNPADPEITRFKDIIYFVNAVGEETDRELNGAKDIT